MIEAGIAWFPGLGYRPAVWAPPHRQDEVDPARLIVAPDADTAYAAKYAPLADIDPLAPLGNWGTVLPPLPDAAPVTAASLAATAPASTPAAPGPWWPSSAPPVWWHPAPGPDYPCQCITDQPPNPLPPMAPVPVGADAAALLIAAIAALATLRARKDRRHG